MPSMPGILTSMRTMSGFSSSARSTPSAPSAASPTTSMSSCTSRKVRRPRRTTWWSSTSRTLIASATGYLHLDRGALAGRRFHGQLAADPAGAVPHGDQTQVASRAAYGLRVEAVAVVRHAQDGSAAAPVHGDVDVGRARVPQRVVQGLLGDAEHGLLLGRGQRAEAAGGEGHARGVGAVQDLDVGAEGGGQAVLVQGRGAQLDHGGAQFVGGLGGERGHLLHLVLGAGGVAVDEGGGGLGGQAQGEELLADRVVQFVGQPGALLGDGELAAAFVEAGIWGGGRRGVGGGPPEVLVLLREAAAAFRLWARGGGGGAPPRTALFGGGEG